jgi:hypothetical protein
MIPKITSFLSLSIFLFSCEKMEDNPTMPYDNGVIVVNSGNFFDNNGSLSFIPMGEKTAQTDIFMVVNGRALAGGVSDYTEVNNKGIILVDNASPARDLVEIVEAGTFKAVATIPSADIENPRKVVKVTDTKAYITAWDFTGDFSNFYPNTGYVAVLDVNTYKIIKKIKVQAGAESIVVIGKEAFVGSGGSGKQVVSVIDINTDAVKQTFELGADPQVIGLDANGKLFVYAENACYRLNPSTKAIEAKLPFSSNSNFSSPSSFVMSADKKAIYFTYSYYDAADGYKQKGQTIGFSTTASEVNTQQAFIKRLFAGGLGVDSQTGQFYGGVVPSFKQAGYVLRYSASGMLVDSVKAEIVPSKFYFKN